MIRISGKSKPLLTTFVGWLTISTCLALPNNSLASPPPYCDKPAGADIDDSLIKVLDFGCDDSEDPPYCGARILAPLEAHGRKFQIIELALIEGEDADPALSVGMNWSLSGYGDFAETNFWVTKRWAKMVQIRAVYEARIYGPRIACVLTSSLGFDELVAERGKGDLD